MGSPRSPIPGISGGQRERDERFHQHGVFEVGQEIAVTVSACGLDFVDLVLVEPNALEAAKAKDKTEHHNQEKRTDFL
jgi:hypothetical protein